MMHSLRAWFWSVLLLLVLAPLCGNGLLAQTVAVGTAPTEPVQISSPTQTATISFTSHFTLGAIDVVTQGITGLDYINAGGGTCTAGNVYTSGSSCSVNYTFTPLAPGMRAGAIEIFDNSSPTPVLEATVYLNGMGTGALAALTPGLMTTLAGTGTAGYGGDNSAAISAAMNGPLHLAVDAGGNIFFADSQNQRIRKIAHSTGIITTVAGNGTAGNTGDNGPATSAELDFPSAVVLDGAGNLYISDRENSRIRKVSAATGIITPYAGTGTPGSLGDNGPAISAELVQPWGEALDGAGNLYIADFSSARIRKVTATTGIITTVAGDGTPGYSGDNGPATSAQIDEQAGGLAVDPSGDLYIADENNQRVRLVSAATGRITTVAGTGTPGYTGNGAAATSAELFLPLGITLDPAGNLYIADVANYVVRKVSAATGIISTIAGNHTQGYVDNVAATSAEMDSPEGLTTDSAGNIYITDTGNNVIRTINVGESVLNYATTNVGSTSADSPQAVLLSNIGNATLTAAAPGSGTNAALSLNFNFSAATTCPDSGTGGLLPPGSDCVYSIDFVPTTGGPIQGSALLTDNSLAGDLPNPTATTSQQTIVLNGTGNGPLGTQSIAFTAPASPVVYGVAPIALVASGGASGKPVLFSVLSGPGSISGSQLTITGTGAVVVAANQAGDANYTAAPQVTQSVTVLPATLTLAATNATRVYGTANPVFTGSITGQQNGDTFTESFSSAATPLSPAASYAIVPAATGVNLADYTESIQNGALVITQAGTNLGLSASSQNILAGQNDTYTATVTSLTSGTPTGTVQFLDNGVSFGTGTLTAGVAVLNSTSLTTGGTHTVTIYYLGDVNFLPNTSSPSVNVAVTAQDFTISLASPSTVSMQFGESASFILQLTPQSGSYYQTVNFSYGGAVPLNAVVTFSPSSIAPNAGTADVTFTVATTKLARNEIPGGIAGGVVLCLMLLPLATLRRIRAGHRWFSRAGLTALLLLAIAGTALGTAGCGSGYADETYPIVVTANSGNVTHSATVTVHILHTPQ
jgi:sugar lactone lactonase YvrE